MFVIYVVSIDFHLNRQQDLTKTIVFANFFVRITFTVIFKYVQISQTKKNVRLVVIPLNNAHNFDTAK